jgi:hypothetical protein
MSGGDVRGQWKKGKGRRAAMWSESGTVAPVKGCVRVDHFHVPHPAVDYLVHVDCVVTNVLQGMQAGAQRRSSSSNHTAISCFSRASGAV